jgi:Uma2 family endonuclease
MTIATTPKSSVDPLFLNIINAKLSVTPEDFDQLCLDNPDLRLELTKDGELIAMPPTGGETGNRNLNLGVEVGIWNRDRVIVLPSHGIPGD